MTDASDPAETRRAHPTSARGQRTRSRLVAAAREVFLRDGYAETTATAITTQAGVGYGSFYVYFPSKQEALLEVAEELMDEVYRGSRAPQDELDPSERLAHENRRYFELYRENARLFELLQDAVRNDPAVRSAWQVLRKEQLHRLARSLQRLQEEGVMDTSLDPYYVAECLGAMAERTAYLTTVDSDLDVDALQATMSAVWSGVLGLQPPRARRPGLLGRSS